MSKRSRLSEEETEGSPGSPEKKARLGNAELFKVLRELIQRGTSIFGTKHERRLMNFNTQRQVPEYICHKLDSALERALGSRYRLEDGGSNGGRPIGPFTFDKRAREDEWEATWDKLMGKLREGGCYYYSLGSNHMMDLGVTDNLHLWIDIEMSKQPSSSDESEDEASSEAAAEEPDDDSSLYDSEDS